jgi:hypothetical protein
MPRRSDQAYSGTKVPIHRSQEQIRGLLIGNGAIGFQFTELIAEEIIELKWARRIVVDGRASRQPLRIRLPMKGRRPEQMYRALYYHLKAKFETIRFGIISFEEEFLPYFEFRLADGRAVTVAEQLLPGLRNALPLHLEPLQLLGAPRPEADP